MYYLDSHAIFSPDRQYRYKLSRTWDYDEPKAAFIMLNPSVADESINDPTVSRCVRYAMDWGYGTLIVGNLFAIISTKPQEIWKNEIGHDPIGPENDRYIREINREADLIIVAWGNHGVYNNRGNALRSWKNPRPSTKPGNGWLSLPRRPGSRAYQWWMRHSPNPLRAPYSISLFFP